MLLPKWAIYGREKSRFIQEAGGIFSSLCLKTPLSKSLLFGDILFWILLNAIALNDFSYYQR